MKENFKKVSFWPIVSAVLFFALIGVLVFSSKTIIDGEKVINKEKAGEKVINFINDAFLQGQDDQVELIEISEESGLYKVKMMWGVEEINSYVTRDGKLLFPEFFEMDEFQKDLLELDGSKEIIEIEGEEIDNQEENVEETSKEKDKIENLVDCLKNKNFVIYGANWCSHCRDLVNLFGGYKKVGPIYVECTEKQDFCQEKNVTAYPTIFINDQPYKGERTLDGFALETRCSFN